MLLGLLFFILAVYSRDPVIEKYTINLLPDSFEGNSTYNAGICWEEVRIQIKFNCPCPLPP